MEELTRYLNITWVLIAAAMVFFMQAGFAMVESGFTRSKNAGNIIMKNTMDFSIGSIFYFLIGFGVMFGDSFGGLFGISGFFNPQNLSLGVFDDLTPATFILFQTVFCATAATIVSGAMAERTRFISYLCYSAGIGLVIYPVVGHWIWGGGWLGELGFVDFAGSTVVHSVGGWAALVGASIIGPRIGKYSKSGKVNAIPGHSMTLAALGVFILWFGWFGFNAGSELAANLNIGHIAMTTNLAASAGAIVAMILTWIKYGKPDVGMTLNGILAGLVAITAGCAAVSLWGSIVIGAVAGFIVVFAIEFIDKVMKIDDPVGAVSVHGICGVFGTLMVGLFSVEEGLFYTGSFHLLGVQAIGIVAVAAWVIGTSFILFKTIKATTGLRASEEEEIIGLDLGEHSMESYPDFVLK